MTMADLLYPPKGKWNIRVFTDKGYVYHQTNGLNTLIEINDKNQKFDSKLSIPVQVKGNMESDFYV